MIKILILILVMFPKGVNMKMKDLIEMDLPSSLVIASSNIKIGKAIGEGTYICINFDSMHVTLIALSVV